MSAESPRGLWPSWLEKDLPGLGIWLVGYPAAKTNWTGHALELAERADGILRLLLSEASLSTGNIVLVGHSQGGLLAKQIVKSADRDAHSEVRVDEFLNRIRGLVFLGTPHSGSGFATIVNGLKLLTRPSAATRGLKKSDPQLRELEMWYRKFSASKAIKHLILAEGKSEKFLGIRLPEHWGRIVSSESADPGLPETPLVVDETHETICKPNRGSAVYAYVKDFVAGPFDLPPRALGIVEALDKNTDTIQALVESSRNLARKYTGPVDRAVLDAEVYRRLRRILQRRFFASADTAVDAEHLVDALTGQGGLAQCSPEVRDTAFAWAARLFVAEHDEKARELIALIRDRETDVVLVAQALLEQKASNFGAALKLVNKSSKACRSAAFICVFRENGLKASLDWLRASALKFNDLDGDAQTIYLSHACEEQVWTEAFAVLDQISEEDLSASPALCFWAANAHFKHAVPDELRDQPLHHLPLGAKDYPLRGDPENFVHRRKAISLYARASSGLAEVGLQGAEAFTAERALWLRLLDPDLAEEAKKELRNSLARSEMQLSMIGLAIEFNIDIDLQLAEAEVDRQTALSGGESSDAALARLALTRAQGSYRGTATYLSRHREQLLKHFDWKSIYFFEVEALAKAGDSIQAEARLAEAVSKGLTAEEADWLRRLVDESQGLDPIVARQVTYQQTGKVTDLHLLVDAYEVAENWRKVAELGKELVDRTGNLREVKRYVYALYRIGDLEKGLSVLEAYPDVIRSYESLALLKARMLFELGRLDTASLLLSEYKASVDTHEGRRLEVDLAVIGGDWTSLQSFVESEWSCRGQRTPTDLLRAASIAQQIGSRRERELVIEAAARSNENAAQLLACYQASVRGGWEHEQAWKWFERASYLSTESNDGLIQTISLEHLIEQRPAWDKRVKETWNLIKASNAPLLMCGEVLNRSLLSLFLLPAVVNANERDVRKRTEILAFSGARAQAEVNPEIIAMEPTSLITAELLDIFDIYLATFNRIVIPHATLGWLLKEQSEILLHQPSRLSAAKDLKRLISEKRLQVFESTANVSDYFINEVGESLAQMLVAAEQIVDGRQRIVVRGGPICRAGSLLREAINVDRYLPYLCSSVNIVNRLVLSGVLTEADAEKARQYLSRQEQIWSTPPAIADDAILFLDDVAVSHLEHLGILSKLHLAGLVGVVTSERVAEADALIAYEANGSEVLAVVTRLREKIHAGLKAGKIVLSKALRREQVSQESDVSNHPTAAMLLALDDRSDIEAAVFDDRFFNQHMYIGAGERQRPLITTVDVLEILFREGKLSKLELIAHRTKLRRLGYSLMPIHRDELSMLLKGAPVVDGRVVETAELRAVRESVLRIRMGDTLQIPKEAHWLQTLLSECIYVLRNQWIDDFDESKSEARSDWLLSLANVEGWTHVLNESVEELALRRQSWLRILMVLPVLASGRQKEAYWNWFESRILQSVMEEEPNTICALAERAKELILDFASKADSED